MKYLLLLFFLIPFQLSAQDTTLNIKKNTLYVELIGSGGIFSVNYDRILLHKNKHKFTARVGVCYLSQAFLFPYGINYLYGRKHHLELGIGLTTYLSNTTATGPTAQVGYRYQKPEGGFMFRAGVAPVFLTASELEGFILPIPALGIGYTFKAKK